MPVIRNLRALKRAKKAKVLEPNTYFVPKGELVLELRDSTDSLIFEKREKLTISSAVSWEKLMSNLEIKEDGNLKVYIDNSSSDKVYFDEFIIERTEATVAVVVQENHYYPFGMNMRGIEELDLQSLSSTDEHRFQYNGKEKEESFGLYWSSYGAREYDMQLARWNGIDALADVYSSTSSYVYTLNNPIIYTDPDGNVVRDKDGNIIFSSNGQQTTSASTREYDIKRNSDGTITFKVVESTYTEGSIYADNGTAVEASSYSHSEEVTYVQGTDGQIISKTSKKIDPSKMGADCKADCHGLTFANNRLWINDGAVQAILDNDDEVWQTGVEDLADFAVYKRDGNIVHSAVKNEDGTYNNNAGTSTTEYNKTLKESSRGLVSSIRVADPAKKKNNNTGTVFFYFKGSGDKILNTSLGTVKDGVRTITDKDEIQKLLKSIQ